jgi:hypothetical protein
VIAVWIYQDASMAVAHVDFKNKERSIVWDAPDAHQFNYDSVEELRIRLATMNLEIPDRLDRILSRKCRSLQRVRPGPPRRRGPAWAGPRGQKRRSAIDRTASPGPCIRGCSPRSLFR